MSTFLWIFAFVVEGSALIIGNVVLIVAGYDFAMPAVRRWRRSRVTARSGMIRFPVSPMGRRRS